MTKKINKGFIAAAGFTLVEMLVYLGIFSMLLIVLMQLFTVILGILPEYKATSSVTQDGNFILTRLTYDIQQNPSVIASPALGVSNSSLQITGANKNFVYQLSGGNLVLINNITGAVDQLNSANTNVTSIAFTTLGSSTGSKRSVQVVLTLSSKTIWKGGNPETLTLETAIATR